MPPCEPWHSIRPTDRPVYHDNTLCREAKNIELRYRRTGTGDRRRCEECDKLNRERR
jgi:hypothetical protein